MTSSLMRLGDLAEFVNGLAFTPDDWQENGARIIRNPESHRSIEAVQSHVARS
jgi:hypothetical protein